MKTTTEAPKSNVQTSTGPTIGDLINKAKSTNPDGGSLNLSDIEKALKLNRHDLIELIKNTSGLSLCFGRKGRTSTCLFGRAAEEFDKEKNARNKASKTPAKRHYNKSAQATQEIVSESFHSPILRIRLGAEIKDIPIELSLVAA